MLLLPTFPPPVSFYSGNPAGWIVAWGSPLGSPRERPVFRSNSGPSGGEGESGAVGAGAAAQGGDGVSEGVWCVQTGPGRGCLELSRSPGVEGMEGTRTKEVSSFPALEPGIPPRCIYGGENP